MLRCSEMVEKGETKDLKPTARQLYLLDAACDAANSHFLRMNAGQDRHASRAELRASASAGLTMLSRALVMPGDPMKLRPALDAKVATFIGQLIKRVAKQREKVAAAKAQETRRRADERRAEEAALAEATRKRTRHNVGAMLIVAMLLLAGAMAFSQ